MGEGPNAVGGVPFIAQPVVKSGETFTCECTAPNAGSRMHHSHHNAAQQTPRGMPGAFIIEPKRPNVGQHGLTLDGQSFLATEPIGIALGQKPRPRYTTEA